jgi:hypothetical protein
MDANRVKPSGNPLPLNKRGFVALEVEPYPDRRRVRLRVRLGPFEKPPDIEIEILNAEGKRIADTSVIEVHERVFELTLHLRGPEDMGTFRAVASMRHRGQEVIDRVETVFQLPIADQASW